MPQARVYLSLPHARGGIGIMGSMSSEFGQAIAGGCAVTEGSRRRASRRTSNESCEERRQGSGTHVSFMPLDSTAEDPATGRAATATIALLAALRSEHDPAFLAHRTKRRHGAAEFAARHNRETRRVSQGGSRLFRTHGADCGTGADTACPAALSRSRAALCHIHDELRSFDPSDPSGRGIHQ